MSESFISEIKLVGFDYAPRNWAFCNGQLLPIQQNAALFSLLGTTYGGNGTTNFALPNLQGRAPMHFGSGFTQGQVGGEELHTLLATEIPQHTHTLSGNTTSTTNVATPAAGNSFGVTSGKNRTGVFPANIYNASGGATATLSPSVVGNFGASQGHENRQPFLVMNWIICLFGIFPSRN